MVVAASFFTLIILFVTDTGREIHYWLEQNDDYLADEILLTVVAVAFGLWWFSYRRWREYQAAEIDLSNAIEALPNGFVLFDAEDRLVICNENFRKTYPASAHLMKRGVKFEDLIRFSAANGEIVEAGNTPEAIEAWIKQRLAKHRAPQGVSEQPLANGRWLRIVESQTKEGGVVGYRIDITDLKNAEKELIDSRDKLEEIVAARTAEVKEKADKLELALHREKSQSALQRKFVSLVSHEFRTPTAIIDGAAQRLLRHKDNITPDEVELRVGKIRSAVQRMIGLIDTTLYATRLDEGKIDVRMEPCNIDNLLREVCERQSEISPAHQIVLETKNLPNDILADNRLLDQVFTNLLSNAVKYSPESPIITVKGWNDGENALVSITDQGIGIPAEDMEHMFQRFFRARTAEGFEGTGIGLSMVKEFVNLLGGSIGVDSLEGEGTTFTVRLPFEAKRERPSGQPRMQK